MLESGFCGLSFSGLQYQYRFFTNGLSGVVRVGQDTHDDSIAHFADNGGSIGRARGKHSLVSASSVTTPREFKLRADHFEHELNTEVVCEILRGAYQELR